MIGNEARIEVGVIVYNEGDQVIQVHREPWFACECGTTMNVIVVIDQPDLAHRVDVLLKPVPKMMSDGPRTSHSRVSMTRVGINYDFFEKIE